MLRFIAIVVLAAFVLALDYPLAEYVQHGLDPQFWPDEAITPRTWFHALASLNLALPAKAYAQILMGSSEVFAHGGWWWQPLIMPITVLLGAAVMTAKRPELPRDPSNLFGSARFADDAERAAMRHGLELGIDRKTGRAVRVSVEGTLVSIAPPRTGKTSGLIIPNLAYPEPQAWNGPAVVIDPKGEVYQAVAGRRRVLGRRVICMDPLGLVGGDDTWNPMAGLNASDVLYLQRTARALLPEQAGNDDSSAYFRNRAIDLIAGAMVVALNGPNPSVVEVHRLLNDEDQLIRELQNILEKSAEPAVSSALDIMQSDSKTRDPIKSTASQAFQWLADKRMQKHVEKNTFQLSDLLAGDCDLFVVLPTEDMETLAPFLRWFLSDLFNAVRRNRPAERIIVFLDEAKAIGRFSAILNAAGELPGYGLSIWTFWQYRSQVVGLYGEEGASTIVNTAEVVTVSDLSAVDPQETERWSRAIGAYTAKVETLSHPTDGGKSSPTKSQAPQAAPLMSKEELVAMPSTDLLVFLNSRNYPRHPLRIRKTVSFKDARFKRFIQNVAPTGKSR